MNYIEDAEIRDTISEASYANEKACRYHPGVDPRLLRPEDLQIPAYIPHNGSRCSQKVTARFTVCQVEKERLRPAARSFQEGDYTTG